MKINHKADYAERRRKDYPSIEEQLDAVWKGGVAMEEMRERILSVKMKFPKTNSHGVKEVNK